MYTHALLTPKAKKLKEIVSLFFNAYIIFNTEKPFAFDTKHFSITINFSSRTRSLHYPRCLKIEFFILKQKYCF